VNLDLYAGTIVAYLLFAHKLHTLGWNKGQSTGLAMMILGVISMAASVGNLVWGQ
jgi:hypothetical protein